MTYSLLCCCLVWFGCQYPEHVASTREGRVACWDLVGKLEGKRPLGKSGSRWEDNIKMNLRETG